MERDQAGDESLELRTGVTYIEQDYTNAITTQNLIGSTFQEDYRLGLRHGVTFTQELILTPAWNNSNALSGSGSAVLTLPVEKRIKFTVGVTDNYLHDPAAGFKKNSFQANMGITYALR